MSCHAFGAQLFLQLHLVSDSEHRCILFMMLHCFFFRLNKYCNKKIRGRGLLKTKLLYVGVQPLPDADVAESDDGGIGV